MTKSGESAGSGNGALPPPRPASALRIRAVDLADVLAYLVVLGLFVQFFPAVISESFLLTLLTAVLLKAALELVTWVKKRAIAGIRRPDSAASRVISVVTLVLLLPGSKFVILWLTELLFGGEVELGGFFLVTLLVITLMLARAGVRWVLGPDRASAASPAPE